MLALADVLVDQVHALAAVLTRVAVALVELVLAAVAGVAGVAVAGVAGDAVHAGAVVAGVRLAVVDVAVAQRPFVAWRCSRDQEEHPVRDFFKIKALFFNIFKKAQLECAGDW